MSSKERISVKNRCKARFSTGGEVYDNVHLLELGTDGCRAEVPARLLERISGDTVLEGWTMIHPLLPTEAIGARVVATRQGTRFGHVEAEVQFVDASDDYQREVRTCVTHLARPWWPVSSSTGMPFPDTF